MKRINLDVAIIPMIILVTVVIGKQNGCV